MATYIEKDALVAEIDDWRDKIMKGILIIPLEGHKRADATFEYEIFGLVRDFIDTLEVKEVDLEVELANYNREYVDENGFFNTEHLAKHFFELGLQSAQKEEPKKCMYSKDDYTDEDRKVLCDDGCEKECKCIKSDDFTKALAECIMQAQGSVVDPMVQAEIWKDELIKLAKSEEPVSDDLEKASKEWIRPQLDKSYADYGETKMMELTHFDGYAMLDAIEFGVKWQKAKDHSCLKDLGEYINELSKQFPEVSFAKLSRIAVRVAKWQKEHLWKPADDDDLPEYDREVIALLNDGKVVFAHRPYKGKYIGKNLTTGNIETFENETYDEGGWNIPDVKYWLDVDLPKMED